MEEKEYEEIIKNAFERRDLLELLKIEKELEENDPYSLLPIVWEYIAYVYIEINKDYDKAIEYSEKIPLKISNHFRTFFVLATAYRMKGKIDLAIDYYLKTINAAKTVLATNEAPLHTDIILISAYFDLGITYSSKREFKKAIKCFEKVVASNYEHLKQGANLYLGNIYILKNDLKTAELYLKNAISFENNDYTQKANLWLGYIYEEASRTQEAIYHLEKSISFEKDLTYPLANCLLAGIYLSLNDEEKGISYFKKVVQYGDTIFKQFACIQLIDTYSEKEDFSHAFEYLNKLDGSMLYRREFLDINIIINLIDKAKASNISDNLKNNIINCFFKLAGYAELSVQSLEDKYNLRILLIEILLFKSVLFVAPSTQQSITHYTTRDVCENILLNFGKEPNPILLTNVMKANDPKEGKSFVELLLDEKNKNQIKEALKDDTNLAFISCFCFNNDYLNQFRLYGKENSKEGTGCAITLKTHFFAKTPDTIFYLKERNAFCLLGIDLEINTQYEKDLLPLYRVIYMNCDKKKQKKGGRDEGVIDELVWNDVLESIVISNLPRYEKDKESNTIEENNTYYNVRVGLQNIRNWFDNNKDNPTLTKAGRQLLIEIQYLIKDIGYQEERECRLITIKQLNHESVYYHPVLKNFVIDYRPLRDHISKITTGPQFGIDAHNIFKYYVEREMKKIYPDKNFEDFVQRSKHTISN